MLSYLPTAAVQTFAGLQRARTRATASRSSSIAATRCRPPPTRSASITRKWYRERGVSRSAPVADRRHAVPKKSLASEAPAVSLFASLAARDSACRSFCAGRQSGQVVLHAELLGARKRRSPPARCGIKAASRTGRARFPFRLATSSRWARKQLACWTIEAIRQGVGGQRRDATTTRPSVWRRYILAVRRLITASSSDGRFRQSAARTPAWWRQDRRVDYLGGGRLPEELLALRPCSSMKSGCCITRCPTTCPDLESTGAAAEVSVRTRRSRSSRAMIPEVFDGQSPETIAHLHIDLNQAPAEIAALEALFDRASCRAASSFSTTTQWSGVYSPPEALRTTPVFVEARQCRSASPASDRPRHRHQSVENAVRSIGSEAAVKIHEYQGKEIFRRYGIPVPRGIPGVHRRRGGEGGANALGGQRCMGGRRAQI